MTTEPVAPGEPRRPLGARNPGDAWVIAPTGERYWGRFGAAGLLAHDAARGILLQHRVSWSHFGGTWGLPGGARHEGESAVDGAVREATEEAGVPDAAVRPLFTSVLDLGYWSYTTLVAEVVVPFEPVISDPESHALEWVPVAEVDSRPLHPGFADAWPSLREWLGRRPLLVVDGANVVGSRPDGWWRDRAGAAARLRDSLAGLVVAGSALGRPGAQWHPDVTLVVEGAARALDDSVTAVDDAHDRVGVGGSVRVVRAERDGDGAIVEVVADAVARGIRPDDMIVVTSDRELARRVGELGSAVHGAGWLLGLL